MSYEFSLRVYYEDTDMAGIVYYANYLKFIERARSEWVRSLGLNQQKLRLDHDLVFAVRRVEADYLAAAHLDDDLLVQTDVAQITGARLVMHQRVLKQDTTLFEAIVTVIMMTTAGQPVRLPAEIRRLIQSAQ